jgi:NAD-dependent dihydropyrimidine dehydrogenase PreA subunit
MTSTWYPVINYDACINDLACVEFCPHGVFEASGGKSVVAHPENCIEFCRGCQKGACPADAISYPADLLLQRRP